MEVVGSLLDQYGLWALAVGAFFQGYTLVVLAGLLVSQRHLNGFDVWIVAAISAWVGHWFFFGLGRWLGKRRHFISNNGLNRHLDSLETRISDHPWSAMFLTQYGYGVRLVGAVAFGLARVRRRWFAWAQSLNCALWAMVLASIGYCAGSGLLFLPEKFLTPAAMGITLTMILFVFLKKKQKFSGKCVEAICDE